MLQPVYQVLKSLSYIVICFIICLNIVPAAADADGIVVGSSAVVIERI
ncbi:hypothetical protein SAMN06273572_102254 [Monaibacterium marinum]|uniref:Uncharacterized protein n=1 Tax=Pontivivens marinum TaxID=1690039 RepID=A0A2C9CQT3_9RHOB|nr:hypothetical protein SAMN06273572_102254 [Monaibacterium marinum]